MEWFLMNIGGCTLLVVSVVVVILLFNIITEWIAELKHAYRIKHRFDKPPTAKCYCIDCRRHDDVTKRCYRFEYESGYQCTADNWFCWEAEPRDKEKTK